MKTIDFLVQELPKCGGWPEGATGAGFICGQGELYFWDKDGCCPSAWILDVREEIEDPDSEVSREQYETALAAKNEGWIDWGGGECPVECGTVVDVKYRDGVIKKGLRALIANSGRSASRLFWVKDNIPTDIIAYRLHQPQEVAQTEAGQEADLNDCIGQTPATEWNGEGLPPAGCVCERSWAGDKWLQCKIIFTGDEIVLVKLATREAAYQLSDVRFRPIRSEAERKRSDIIDALTNFTLRGDATDIYDAIAAGKIPGIKLEG